MNPRIHSLAGAVLVAVLLPTSAFAQGSPSGPPQGGGGGGRPPGPPPEAIAACKGKAVGDTASFTGRRGEPVTGTCQKMMAPSEVLALRPAGGPPPGGGEAPPPKK